MLIILFTKPVIILGGIVFLALISLSVLRAISDPSDAASWIQVAIEAFALPLVLYELNKIRMALSQKPSIQMGIATVKDLPLSNIGTLSSLSKHALVSRGYTFFMLVLRNNGPVPARNVKIHFEYRPPEEREMLTPIIETYEWKGESQYSFSQENQVDFVFRGGQDWQIHPLDFEVFPFFMTTSMVIKTEPHKIRERPMPGVYEFVCTVRAEGLESPVREVLFVEIEERRI